MCALLFRCTTRLEPGIFGENEKAGTAGASIFLYRFVFEKL